MLKSLLKLFKKKENPIFLIGHKQKIGITLEFMSQIKRTYPRTWSKIFDILGAYERYEHAVQNFNWADKHHRAKANIELNKAEDNLKRALSIGGRFHED